MEPSDSFSENVNRFNLDFTGTLIGLLTRINDRPCSNSSDKFLSLANRINYNSFYNHQIELLCVKDSMGVAGHHQVAAAANGGGAVTAAGDRGSLTRNRK